MEHLAEDVGVGKANETVVEKYDRAMGTYQNPIDAAPLEGGRLPTAQMPLQQVQSPFVLGPMTTGER